MDEDIPEFIRKALEDRYEGWELAEMLNIPTAEVIAAFEDIILDHLQELKEELDIDTDESE